MNAEQLKSALKQRGLQVLVVSSHEFDDGEAGFVVYLHGVAGQWHNGYARWIVSRVPGVATAVDAASSPSIILVRMLA